MCEDIGRRNALLTRQHESKPTTIAAPSTTALEKATHPPRGGGVPSSRRDQQVRCCHRHVRNRRGGNRSPIVTSGTSAEATAPQSSRQEPARKNNKTIHTSRTAHLISRIPLNFLSLSLSSTVVASPRLQSRCPHAAYHSPDPLLKKKKKFSTPV